MKCSGKKFSFSKPPPKNRNRRPSNLLPQTKNSGTDPGQNILGQTASGKKNCIAHFRALDQSGQNQPNKSESVKVEQIIKRRIVNQLCIRNYTQFFRL